MSDDPKITRRSFLKFVGSGALLGAAGGAAASAGGQTLPHASDIRPADKPNTPAENIAVGAMVGACAGGVVHALKTSTDPGTRTIKRKQAREDFYKEHRRFDHWQARHEENTQRDDEERGL